jgi:hypothetical protein
MHPLHDHDDTRRCLVVAARKQGGTVPFDDSRPHGLRHGVAKLERIVDDDQVSPEPGERPVDRGCDAFAPLRGRDLAVGVAYRSGDALARCQIRLGGQLGGILFSYGASISDGSWKSTTIGAARSTPAIRAARLSKIV